MHERKPEFNSSPISWTMYTNLSRKKETLSVFTLSKLCFEKSTGRSTTMCSAFLSCSCSGVSSTSAVSSAFPLALNLSIFAPSAYTIASSFYRVTTASVYVTRTNHSHKVIFLHGKRNNRSLKSFKNINVNCFCTLKLVT